MNVRQASDDDVARLYRRLWRPPAGHIHAPHVWAVWDGVGLQVGLQPGVATLPQELRDAHPEFAALLLGLKEPTPQELAERFGAAVARWAAAGLPVMDAEGYAARRAACDGCDLWDAQARLGLGRCRHPGCGCTRLKLWLGTETCPAGKWPA